MGTTRDETQVTFSEGHVLQVTDLCKCQALLHPDVLYQNCYIYILQACESEIQMPLQGTSPSSIGKALENTSHFWLAFLSSSTGQSAEIPGQIQVACLVKPSEMWDGS